MGDPFENASSDWRWFADPMLSCSDVADAFVEVLGIALAGYEGWVR